MAGEISPSGVRFSDAPPLPQGTHESMKGEETYAAVDADLIKRRSFPLKDQRPGQTGAPLESPAPHRDPNRIESERAVGQREGTGDSSLPRLSDEIGILLAMGATAKNIRKIFFFQGALIGIIGTTAGTALGLFWNWLANTLELIKVPVDIYHIAYVPFHLKFLDLALIIGVALLISFLSTLFPSHRASKVDPVVALKYE